MAFLADQMELKPGLILFRRTDVEHRNWYCRVRLTNADRYKTISLKTADIESAKSRAYDHDADIRFRLKHEVPIFNRPFSQIADDYQKYQKARSIAGEISHHRWRVIESHIRTQLNRYVGTSQINLVTEERWKTYPIWRQENGKGRSGGAVSTGTIRDEMQTFRAVLAYAASKSYIKESQVPKAKLPFAKERREEFTPDEYRKLHTFARSWIKTARTGKNAWEREVIYNFVLIMSNTGMRPSEAKNLAWRDVQSKTHRDGQSFVIMNVRGKKKFRSLVAAQTVGDYLERIRKISKATELNDRVFTNWEGKPSASLYHGLLVTLLKDSKLLLSSTGKRRSTYCFRHTYATFRLTEGVDVYFLAKQMGTSVMMIEKHYGHINPVKNAERILMGLPGWTPVIAESSNQTGVNAGRTKSKAKSPKPGKT